MSAPRWRRRQDDVAFVDDGEERVAMLDLLHTADPPIILEGPSARIWRLLAEPCTITQLVDLMHGQYAAPRVEIEQGTRAFIDDLASRGLISRVDD